MNIEQAKARHMQIAQGSLRPEVMDEQAIEFDPDDLAVVGLDAQEATLLAVMINGYVDDVLGPIVKHPVAKRLLAKMHKVASQKAGREHGEQW